MRARATICFRCITNPSKGYGNFARALLLAQEMQRKRFSVFFMIDKNSTASKLLKQQKIPFTQIQSSKSKVKESQTIMNTLKKIQCNTIILDMREYGDILSKHLSKHVNVVMIDDAWGKTAHAHFVFNGTMIKQFHNYNVINPDSRLFLGTKYWLSDQHFSKHQKSILKIKHSKKYTVTISMGGSDPDDLTFHAYDSISTIHNIEIQVIVGPFYQNLQKLKNKTSKNKNASILVNPTSIWKEFQKSDLVISNAGSTLFELAIQRIPTVCISVVSHQIPYAKFLHKKGAVKYLGSKKSVTKKQINSIVLNLLDSPLKRKKMSLACKSIIDGKGLSRVSSIIAKAIK